MNPVLVAGFGIMHVDAAQGANCLVPPCPSGDPNFHPAWEQTVLVGGGFSTRVRSGLWLRADARLHIPIAPEDIDRASGNPRPEIALGFVSRF